MKLVDANVLIYAVNEDSEHHQEARGWLDGALSGAARVGFAWVPLLAFVRLVTHPSVFPSPWPVELAMAQVGAWLSSPSAQEVAPTARHPAILAGLLTETGTGGNLVNDAHLATLALEHRGQIVSYDRDFGRFPGVRCERPELTPGDAG